MCKLWNRRGKSIPCLIWLSWDGLAALFSRFPFVILFISLLLSCLTTWLGISWHGLPVFEDPYLGFETRGTSIARRLVALENLRDEFKRLDIIENYPGERIASRESRKRRHLGGHSHLDFCTKVPLEEYSRVAFVLEDGHDLFTSQVIGRLCRFQDLIQQSEEYKYLCEKDSRRDCCPAWSLPNYVAFYANKTNCMEIKKKDIQRFKEDLTCCVDSLRFESNASVGREFQSSCIHDFKTKGIPAYCLRGSPINSTLHHALEKSFIRTNVSKFSMVTFPVPKNAQMPPILEELMYYIDDIQLPDTVVQLGGYDFGTKDELFKELLISDLIYVLVASVIIFVIVCCYTKSVLVTAMSFSVLTLSLGVSYFLYKTVFSISYFPFMNMLVTIIVLGIGTDGTLILSVAWMRCKNENFKGEPFEKTLKFKVMKATLKETTSTLFITTCTTAAAFFASLTSSITTIRCFSVFAGTSIIVSFFLLFFTIPTSLLISDILCHHFKSLFPEEDKNTWISKILKLRTKLHDFKLLVQQRMCRIRTVDYIQTLTATKFAVISFSVFVAILIWGLLTVFHYPGFELPDTEQFQLLSFNHPIEKYDRMIEPLFNIGPDETKEYDNLTFYYIWGVKNVDNGDSFNPNDEGTLEFDENFSLNDVESQNWILNFCKRVKNQSFFDPEASNANMGNYDTCVLETMVGWMDRDCEHPIQKYPSLEPCCNVSKFPYQPQVLSKCIGMASRDIYRTPTTFFRPDIAGAKFFTTYSNASLSEEGDEPDGMMITPKRKAKPVYSRMGEVATYIVRARTNFVYSISYERMMEIFKNATEFFDDAMKDAPEKLENGFFMSAHLNFFDLQHSLLNDTWHSLLLSTGMCFIFICLASRSLLVSLGAVAVLLATVAVSSAILIQAFFWKLGVFESIAVTVAVGLSDFTTHHAIEFAKRGSITMMTSPTFVSAMTTIIMGLSMAIFSQVLVYQQIGSFFCVLVMTSWLYSVFFLSPLLILLDAISTSVWYTLSSIPCRFPFNMFCNKGGPCNQALSEDEAENREECTEQCDCPVGECSCNRNALLPTISGSRGLLPEDRNTLTMEKWKLLKKVAQETTV